jgi:hypothetical protein
MKRLITILISFSLVTAIGCGESRYYLSSDPNYIPVYLPNENCKPVSFKPGLEPEGFNGIKWATELSTLREMKLYRKDSSHGGIDFYLKAGDGVKLRNGKLIPVQYGFWRGRLYVGMVITDRAADWDALKESVFEKYGLGAKPFSNLEEYLWTGKDATMALRYDGYSKEGTYYIRSHSMEKQMQ